MDGSEQSVVASLERQLARLRRLAERLESSHTRLGQAGEGAGTGLWRGPAHTAYVSALRALRAEIAEAREQGRSCGR